MRAISISLVLCIVACAKESRDKESVSAAALPRFEDFFVPERTISRSADLDTTHDSTAKRFGTVLRSALKDGPNFAGHYSIATWDCGTQCLSYAVIDAATGRLAPDTVLDFSCHEVEFRKNSSLVIERPLKESAAPCGDTSTKAFTWTGTAFQPTR
jgi:hypothetical protein